MLGKEGEKAGRAGAFVATQELQARPERGIGGGRRHPRMGWQFWGTFLLQMAPKREKFSMSDDDADRANRIDSDSNEIRVVRPLSSIELAFCPAFQGI